MKEINMERILRKLPGIKSVYKTIDNIINKNNKLQEQINELNFQLNNQFDDLRNIYMNKFDNELFKEDKLAVYTSIIGEYDFLNEVECVDEECEYFCFTDNANLSSDTWRIVDISKNEELTGLDDTRKARYIKTHPHVFLDSYKYSLWCDGNLTIKKSVVEMIKLHLCDIKMLTFIHAHRNNIFEEAEECIRQNKDDESVIRKQIEKYKENNYDDMEHLVMTNVLFRYNDEEMNKFNGEWWNEIKNGSKRDQLSFNYVASKQNMKYDVCTLDAFNNCYFTYNKHLK